MYPEKPYAYRPMQAAYTGDEEPGNHTEDQEVEPENHWGEGDHVQEDSGENAMDDLEDETGGEHEVTAHVVEMPTTHQCRRCRREFPSNNQLHKHIRTNHKMIDHQEKSTEMLVNHGQIIASIAVNHDKEMPTVRHWQYARVGMAFTPTGPTREVCVDSGCSVTLVDRNFLLENHPQAVLRATTIPINVRGIGAHACKCTEYTSIPFYIPGEKNGKPLIAHFTRYAYVVDNLKANMLIGVDVLAPEDMEINFRMRRLTIGSCGGISAKINLSPKLGRTKRIVLAKEPTTIPAKSFRRVQVSLRGKTPLPVDRDLLFAPLNSPTNAGIQAHLVDAEFYFVNVENPTEDPLVIPRKMRLGIITDY